MSVDFRAGVILGWKLTQERYNELPDNIIEDYGIQTNYYSDNGDYFIGVDQECVYEGESALIDVEGCELNTKTYLELSAVIPDIIGKLPNPSLYLYCQIY